MKAWMTFWRSPRIRKGLTFARSRSWQTLALAKESICLSNFKLLSNVLPRFFTTWLGWGARALSPGTTVGIILLDGLEGANTMHNQFYSHLSRGNFKTAKVSCPLRICGWILIQSGQYINALHLLFYFILLKGRGAFEARCWRGVSHERHDSCKYLYLCQCPWINYIIEGEKCKTLLIFLWVSFFFKHINVFF